MKRQGISLLELLVVIFLLVIFVIIVIPGLNNSKGLERRSSCQNNLKQWGVIFSLYAAEQSDYFPPLQITNKNARGWPALELTGSPPALELAAAPMVSSWYPNYNTDPGILICLNDSQHSVDEFKDDRGDWNFWKSGNNHKAGCSYAYFGWTFDLLKDPSLPPQDIGSFDALMSAADAFEFTPPKEVLVPAQFGAAMNVLFQDAAHILDHANLGVKLFEIADKDLEVPQGYGNNGGDLIYRLKRGNERLMTTDTNNPTTVDRVQSTLFVMMDKIAKRGDILLFNHLPGGANVLFMDGHVDWIPYIAPPPDHANAPAMDFGSMQPVLPSMANILDIFSKE